MTSRRCWCSRLLHELSRRGLSIRPNTLKKPGKESVGIEISRKQILEQLQRAANRKMLSHSPDEITEILTEKRFESFGNVFSCFEIFENLR